MRVRVTSSTASRRKPACPAEIVLEAVRGRWTTHILECIADQGALHFGALKRAIPGVSNKVLIHHLRHLEQAGILRRQAKPALRPEVLYSLTSRAQDVKAVLDSLEELGTRWQQEDANKAVSDRLKSG
jgi:DNA-binding HxlR family transcriptional regulator